jgi:hypothetical protein
MKRADRRYHAIALYAAERTILLLLDLETGSVVRRRPEGPALARLVGETEAQRLQQTFTTPARRARLSIPQVPGAVRRVLSGQSDGRGWAVDPAQVPAVQDAIGIVVENFVFERMLKTKPDRLLRAIRPRTDREG